MLRPADLASIPDRVKPTPSGVSRLDTLSGQVQPRCYHPNPPPAYLPERGMRRTMTFTLQDTRGFTSYTPQIRFFGDALPQATKCKLPQSISTSTYVKIAARPRSRVDAQRVTNNMALFQTSPPEPCVPVSRNKALQSGLSKFPSVIRAVMNLLMTFLAHK